MLRGFREFLLRGNVVDLAVAVIIGAAFGTVVTSFVKDILTPLIAAIGGQPDFSALTFTINNSKFLYGEFINAIISFIIVAAVIYFLVVVPMNQLNKLTTKLAAPKAPATRKCPDCLSEIPVGATRCAFCTTVVKPVRSS
jgi:large conductance mechanosensitive channel